MTFARNVTASAVAKSTMGEAKRERVATLMGHALATQRQHYDKSDTMLPEHVAAQVQAIRTARAGATLPRYVIQ